MNDVADDAGGDGSRQNDGDAANHDDGNRSSWFHLPQLNLSLCISLTALAVSVASFYLSRVRPANIEVVPGPAVIMWWNGVGGGTEFQWINSHIRLPLIFANSGAQRSVVREVRLHTKGTEGARTWSAATAGSDDSRVLALPFQIDGGGTSLRTLEFAQPGREHQVLLPGDYEADLEIRTDLSFDWQPIIRFHFKVDRAPNTQLFGQHFSYAISGMQSAD